jgi:hypothetical protein
VAGEREEVRAIDWRFVFATFGRILVASWFVAYSGWLILGAVLQHVLGDDAILYAAAARAWLTGGDPWRTWIEWGSDRHLVFFAAPPPTLLFFAPFAYLPAPTVAAAWVILDTAVLLLVVRRLRLAWWWCFFPPAVSAVTVGNPEPVVLGLLVLGGGRLAVLAPLLKPYAVAPLVGERRWRDLALAACLVVATFIFLPWGRFLSDRDLLQRSLVLQNADLSATAVPWLIPFALIGLAALGWRRAWWLAVPVLWPLSQLHYATITLPAISTITGFGFSVPIPGAPAVAVVAQALFERLPFPGRVKVVPPIEASGDINAAEPTGETVRRD